MVGGTTFEYLAQSCVVFLYPMGDVTKVWCGVYAAPNQIATALHPFVDTLFDRNMILDLRNLHVVNHEGKRLTVKRVEAPRTGDVALVEVEEHGAFIPPHEDPWEIEKGALVYCWAYMISPESPLAMKSVYEERYRFPYWGLWSVGWWGGSVDVTGSLRRVLSTTGDDFWVYMPSIKGQSGSPFITMNPPRLIGVLHATYSVMEGGLLTTGRTVLSSILHAKEEVKVSKVRVPVMEIPGWVYLALGGAAGLAIAGLAQ